MLKQMGKKILHSKNLVYLWAIPEKKHLGLEDGTLFFTHGIQFPRTPTTHVIRKLRTPTTHRIEFSYSPVV